MNFANLKLFKDIAATRSISRGAALNDISQSAASQQIHDLEETLGTHLLDRSRRPLTLTPEGALYHDLCREVLHRKDEFDAELQRLKREVNGTVRVAAIYSVSLSEMSRLEKEFSARQPRVNLLVQYLRPEKVYSAVIDDEADLGIVSYPEPSREIRVIPWRLEEMVLAVAPAHPLAQVGRATHSVLRGIDFVGFDQELPISREVDKYLKEQGIEVQYTAHFDNLQMIKEAVAHGMGVSILPARIMRLEIEQKRLIAVPLALESQLYRPLGIVHRKKKTFQPAAQAFLDLLREPEAA